MKKQPQAPTPTDQMDRRSVIKAGAKVLPVLGLVGLAVTAVAPQARADCFPANCKAICAETCNNNCKGDCMGSCEKVNQ